MRINMLIPKGPVPNGLLDSLAFDHIWETRTDFVTRVSPADRAPSYYRFWPKRAWDRVWVEMEYCVDIEPPADTETAP